MSNDMALPPGLTLRGNSYQLRIHIPSDLQDLYGRKDIRMAIGAMPAALARSMAYQLRGEKEAEFIERRKEVNAQAVTVTDALAQAIAHAVYVRALEQDDELREEPAMRAVLEEVADVGNAPLRALIIPSAPHAQVGVQVVEGLSEKAAGALEGLHAHLEADAAIALARRNLTAVQPLADAAARRMGFLIDWASEGGKSALRASLQQYRAAVRERGQRDLGEIVETPVRAGVSAAVRAKTKPAKAHTLRDVLAPWQSVKQPVTSSVNKYTKAVTLFEEKFGKDFAIQELTKPQGTEFDIFLRTKCKTDKTAKDHFDSVKTLLNFAVDRQDWIPSNPWTRQGVEVKKSRSRQDWTSENLKTLFDSELFSAYQLPTSSDAGGAAAYWVPLLGLYTGARQSDLCQLRIADVAEKADGLWITIMADAGDEANGLPSTTMKTETGRRRVPVHSELMALGFGDYVKDMRKAKEARLFPAIKQASGGLFGKNFSEWFSSYRHSRGFKGRYVDFHAFRHTARTRLTDAGVDGLISSALMGHTSGGGTGRKVYDHSTSTLRPNMERLSYAELGLVRVYPAK